MKFFHKNNNLNDDFQFHLKKDNLKFVLIILRYQMNDSSSKIGVTIKTKEPKVTPTSSHASSIFKNSSAKNEKPKIHPSKPKPELVKARKKMKIQSIDQDPNHESPFLQLLKQRKEGIKKPPPVPTATAYRDDTPIEGFGEKVLQNQGWEPGLKIGEEYVEKGHSHHSHN